MIKKVLFFSFLLCNYLSNCSDFDIKKNKLPVKIFPQIDDLIDKLLLEYENERAEIEFHQDYERITLQSKYLDETKFQHNQNEIMANVFKLKSKFVFIRSLLKENLKDPSETN